MATVRFCDWTKKRLKDGDQTFTVSVDGKEFEVSAEGKQQLLDLLEADELPTQPTVTIPTKVEAPAQAAPQPAPVPLINVETTEDPFDQGPGSAPQPEMAGGEQPPVRDPRRSTQKTTYGV